MAIGRLEAESFAQLVAARTGAHYDPMSSLCLACTDVVKVSGAGLMLVTGGRSLGCVGVSDPVTATVEQIEFTLGEGPCLAAYEAKAAVFDPDLADESSDQWPEFKRGALAAGIRAAFGFPLLVDWICIGALNLYHDVSGELTADQIEDAAMAAKLACRTLLAWQSNAMPGQVAWQLELVPSHRMEVHQATGRISVQAAVTVGDALVMLRAYAFAHDRSIRDVANEVASGDLRFD